MNPTFTPGDQLLVSRTRQARVDISRGDVVVVRDPRDGQRRYLKRVVGLPGERVQHIEGVLLVNGNTIDEDYLGGLPPVIGLQQATWDLSDQQYFVLGDNRAHSTDSREFGPIRYDDIVGIARFRYWPLSKAGPIRRPSIRLDPVK